MSKSTLILPNNELLLPNRNTLTPAALETRIDNEYLGLKLDFDEDTLYNILLDSQHHSMFDNDPALELLDVLSNPDYFYYTCKWLFNVKLLPFQLAILQELWKRKFPMLIATRGGGKTWILSLYAMLRAIFNQGAKIIVVGAAFRQSKLLFEYMEDFWRGSPILRSMIGQSRHEGPKRDVDRCNFYIGDSEIVAIPLGDGSKIRGLRAHYTIADEFASIPQEIFEVVIKGFASVSASPAARVRDMARIRILKSLGMFAEADDVEEGMGFGNQTIISGTAYYSFNHFYEYWKRYKSIIESKGDRYKLEEIFKGDVPEGFSWKDFSVYRIPVHKLPRGFMDESQVHQARAMVHRSIYNMEYGACDKPGTPIITQRGIIPIEQIIPGDLVLTHKGRFKPVIILTHRQYNGKINCYQTAYFNQVISTTTEHPFWYGEDKFRNIDKFTCLVNLKEFPVYYGLHLNLENYCNHYLETYDGRYMYPMSSNSIITISQQRNIRNDTSPIKDIAQIYGIQAATVRQIKNNKNIPKGAVPKLIDLSYSLGLVVGYYAAEGSIGADGRAVSFALDEHKDTQYQQQLLDSIYRVFNLNGHKYIKNKNTIDICINSRLIVQLFTKICPGVSPTKLVNHSLLYSNKEFLLGFLEGYWNGDGHISDRLASVHCVNLNLLSQVRIALSYFGISASLNYKSDKTYDLTLHGDSFRKFMKIIYHKDVSATKKESTVINNDNYSILPVIKCVTEEYNGVVYNMKVQDDESYSRPNATVHNCFARDSEGFFKRSLVESCVTKEPIQIPSGPVHFSATIRGNPARRYIYGIDPASEKDNFAIVILEPYADHRRVVYAWTINRQNLRERIKKQGQTTDKSFYTYCAQKIRALMKVFPTEHIGMDTQGGGITVMEALHDRDVIKTEAPLWPYIKKGDTDIFWWEEADKPTDGEIGSHILHMVQFANAQFTSDCNHGLRKDFEGKVTLMPYFDAVTISEAIQVDKLTGCDYDTLEDCVMDIEELKDELATIQHSQTPSGRDKWDTPEVKLPGNKRGRLRKDRYTALLIANMIARTILIQPERPVHQFVGGYVGENVSKQPTNGQLYYGPDHIVSQMNLSGGGVGVRRNG